MCCCTQLSADVWWPTCLHTQQCRQIQRRSPGTLLASCHDPGLWAGSRRPSCGPKKP
jgi:hypothetical protein